MFTIYSIQKRVLIPLGLFILLAVLFAGCGATSTGGSGTAGSSPPVATSAPVKGYGSANGCPSDMVVSNAPTKANVMLQSSDVNTTITAHNGDVIEVRLPFGHTWSEPAISQGILHLQSPAGYAWKTSNVCVWRFIAQGTGTVELNFTGRPFCKRGQLCPMFIMAVPFKINVK